MKKSNPKEAIQPAEDIETETKFTFQQAIDYLTQHSTEHEGWTIRYYGFGEHLTFWPGDGTFIDFGIDHDTNITWDKMKELIIKSANVLKDVNDKIEKFI